MLKLIAFDIFGTVVDMSGTPREELVAYGEHIRKPEYSPLTLPESWEKLEAFPDALPGLSKLKEKYIIVTLSNGPMGLLTKIAKNNNLPFDTIVPVELARSFKPNPEPYKLLISAFNLKPEEIMMVTANKTFGDLESSRDLGMVPQLIRGDSDVQDIIELYRKLKKC